MRFHYYYLVICLFSLYLSSCSTSKSIERNNSPKKSLSKDPIATTELTIQELINHQLDTSKVLQNAFTGIYIVDLSNDAVLFKSNESKLFTPASNTKVLSCLAGLKYLNDAIPYFKYIEREDSLILKGIGSPVFLHPYLDSLALGTKFLKEYSNDIYLDLNGSIAQKYGPGWAWEDYNYAYQSEKSAFPIYGNMINIKKERSKNELLISPPYFNQYIQADSSIDKTIVRSELKNQLIFNPHLIKDKSFEKFIPFISSNELSVQLLSKAIDKAKHSRGECYPKPSCASFGFHLRSHA